MNLIDAEPIIKNLSAMQTQLGYDAIFIDGMIKALKEADGVGAKPVSRGKWKYHKYVEKYECTECGHFVKPSTGRNYSQNFGARMIEEETK